MATWITCSQCGKIEEITATEQIPTGWREAADKLWCPACADANEDEAVGDVLDEEVIYPTTSTGDTFDDDYCEVCDGPCQGH
jgi:hypothetical protein